MTGPERQDCRVRESQGAGSARVGALSAALFAAALGCGVWATRSVGYQAPDRKAPDAQDAKGIFASVPLHVDSWEGREEPIPKGEWKIMDVDAALSRVYQGPEHSVRLIVETRIGKSRGQFHMPMVCMTSNGWSTLQSGVETIHPPGLAEPVKTVWILMTKEGHTMLVRYWLWADGNYVPPPSALVRQLSAVAAWERLRTANPKGALFLCYTEVPEGADVRSAMSAQAQFAESILPSVDKALSATPALQPRDSS
jgi:EpsI family protein